MRLIMAVSADGYLCRGPDDDMSWTGRADKAVFRLLTLSGDGTLLAGTTTARLMPKLAGRTVLELSRSGLTLEGAAMMHPDAWLIGGPTVALEAAREGLLTHAYLCRVPAFAEAPAAVPVYDLERAVHLGTERHVIQMHGVDVEVLRWPGR